MLNTGTRMPGYKYPKLPKLGNSPQSPVKSVTSVPGSRAVGLHKSKAKKNKAVKMTGSFRGKSNKLGHGGRAAQLKAQGVPGGVIGNLARAANAAKGQKNYHGKKSKPMKKHKTHKKVMCKKSHKHHKGCM